MKLVYDVFETKKLRDIKVGQCFYYPEAEAFLMKTEEVQGITGEIFNAVSLEDGIVYGFYEGLEFQVVDATLLIKKEEQNETNN